MIAPGKKIITRSIANPIDKQRKEEKLEYIYNEMKRGEAITLVDFTPIEVYDYLYTEGEDMYDYLVCRNKEGTLTMFKAPPPATWSRL